VGPPKAGVPSCTLAECLAEATATELLAGESMYRLADGTLVRDACLFIY